MQLDHIDEAFGHRVEGGTCWRINATRWQRMEVLRDQLHAGRVYDGPDVAEWDPVIITDQLALEGME